MKKIHKPCGGEVVEDTAGSRRCLGCSARWSYTQWCNMPFTLREKQFESVWVEAPVAKPDGARYVLEEVEEGKRRFTRLRLKK